MDPEAISEALGNIMFVAGFATTCSIREYTPIIIRRAHEIINYHPASHDSFARRQRAAKHQSRRQLAIAEEAGRRGTNPYGSRRPPRTPKPNTNILEWKTTKARRRTCRSSACSSESSSP